MNEERHIASKEELEEFIENSISQMRESDLKFDNWNVNYFIEASPLRSFLNNQQQLIGKTIDGLLTMGCIFNQEDIDEDDEDIYLRLDEPIVVMIGGIQFEIWCYTDSRVKIGINSLTLKEKSYQPYDWRDCSNSFSNIIGQRIIGFEIKDSKSGFYDSLGLGDRPDGGDYFESFSILIENNKKLTFYGDFEYMGIYVENIK